MSNKAQRNLTIGIRKVLFMIVILPSIVCGGSSPLTGIRSKSSQIRENFAGAIERVAEGLALRLREPSNEETI